MRRVSLRSCGWECVENDFFVVVALWICESEVRKGCFFQENAGADSPGALTCIFSQDCCVVAIVLCTGELHCPLTTFCLHLPLGLRDTNTC